MYKLVLVFLVVLMVSIGFGQEAYLELLRSDIQTEKKEIIAATLNFTDEEASKFWPIYREYELELAKLGDARLALIKDYAKHYENMTDVKAKELAKESFRIEENTTKLRKKYYGKIEKALSSIQAVRFAQLDRRIGMLLDLQISSEIPIMMGPDEKAEGSGSKQY
jgi:hypothetical protein